MSIDVENMTSVCTCCRRVNKCTIGVMLNRDNGADGKSVIAKCSCGRTQWQPTSWQRDVA
ncbi:hypothetical protein LCGC14_1727750 [marine sediment metagenome]|uniref:Uncharacterized protein n=1 Tax=marine sediment metagenome TaxID=412755 RepID=A0A0F9HAH3_9ZZZZ